MGNSQTVKKNKSCFRFLIGKIFKTQLSKLASAIKAGNLSLVRQFFARKVNFNQYLNNGDTPFHVAVRYDKLDIVKFMVENIPNLGINDKNFIGDTPLLIAIMNGNLQMVEYLVTKKNVDLNIPENKGFSPFMAACASGNLNLVKFLVSHDCDYKARSKDGQSAIHRAAFYGHIEVLKYLVKDLKMNPSLPDRKGNLPLHYACMKLNISCIRVLLKASNQYHGGNGLLHIENKFGVKAIDILLRVLKKVREYDDPNNSFEQEQIEDYIFNKQNLPPLKRAGQNTTQTVSRSPSVYDVLKIRRRSTIYNRDNEKSTSPLLRLTTAIDLSNNEKPLDSQDIHSPTTEEIRDTEEELLKPSKIPFGLITEEKNALLLFKGASFGLPEAVSPQHYNYKSINVVTPRIMKEGKAVNLRINTGVNGPRRRSLMKANSFEALSFSSNSYSNSEDIKSPNFIPQTKSRFANPGSP